MEDPILFLSADADNDSLLRGVEHKELWRTDGGTRPWQNAGNDAKLQGILESDIANDIPMTSPRAVLRCDDELMRWDEWMPSTSNGSILRRSITALSSLPPARTPLFDSGIVGRYRT